MALKLRVTCLVLLAVMMLVVPLAISFSTLKVASPIKFLLIRLIMVVVFSLWLVARGFEKPFDLRASTMTLPVVTYAGVCLMASLFALNSVGSLVVFHDLFWCIAIFVVVANSGFDERSFLILATAITCAAFLAACYGVLQRFDLAFNEWIAPEGEPVGTPSTFGHRNYAAEYMAASVPFVVALFFRARNILAKACIGLVIPVILFFIFFAGSRASWIAVISAAVVSFWISIVKARRATAEYVLVQPGRTIKRLLSRWEIRVVAGSVIILFAVAPFLLRPDFEEFIQDARTTFTLKRGSNMLRLSTWQSSADLALANPVLGVGLGNYEVFLPEHWNLVDRETFARKNRVSKEAHNEYLQVACDTGFIGLAAFTWIIAAALVVGVRSFVGSSSKEVNWILLAAVCSVVAALVNASFAFNLTKPSTRMLFWFSLGCIGAAENQLARQRGPDRTDSESAV